MKYLKRFNENINTPIIEKISSDDKLFIIEMVAEEKLTVK